MGDDDADADAAGDTAKPDDDSQSSIFSSFGLSPICRIIKAFLERIHSHFHNKPASVEKCENEKGMEATTIAPEELTHNHDHTTMESSTDSKTVSGSFEPHAGVDVAAVHEPVAVHEPATVAVEHEPVAVHEPVVVPAEHEPVTNTPSQVAPATAAVAA